MANKAISQKRWARGVNAATGVLSQQPGTIIRASNLLLTQRGSLQACDGSAEVSSIASPYTYIEEIESFANLVPGQFPYYSALALNQTPQLGNVTGFSGNINVGAGTNNPAGHTFYGIVATLSGGHSDISVTQIELSSVVPWDGATFNWTSVSGATGYTIYVYQNLSANPSAWTVVALGSVGATTTFTFTGVLPTSPQIAQPNGNTTCVLQLFVGAISSGNLLFNAVTAGVYASPPILPASLAPGDPLFNPTQQIPGFSPYGGLSGAACLIPKIVQFSGFHILILGNGEAPHYYNPSNGTGATVSALTNTFNALYPSWQATVSWLSGDLVQATVSTVNYYFTASQGGVSGSTTPSWNTTTGSQTPDGSVLWVCQGPIPASTAPRGSAHAVSYAGSLWIANTSPQTTSDNLDGPTCLKMSDANNPNSWNPVNTAFIGKDDGTQITGLQPFTIAAVGISPTGSMAVFKEFQTYQIIGVFGSSDFEIQPAQTDMGCLAPRSIQFIPGFGICRYCHLGFAVYEGVSDRVISEEIRPYLFGGIGPDADLTPVDPQYVYLSKSAQSVSPPMYMCAMPLKGSNGALTRVFCYDLIMKGWVIIDLPWAIASLNRISVGEGNPLVLAGKTDGTIQRLQSGDTSWENQSSINWGFRSPAIYGEGSSQRLFFRQFAFRGYGTSSQAASITANLTVDGASQGQLIPDIVPQPGNQFEVRFRVMMNGQIAYVDVSGSGQMVLDDLDWTIVPKAQTARRVFS